MKNEVRRVMVCVAVSALFALGLGATTRAQEMPAEYRGVLSYLGKKGDYKAGVLKVNIPRNDLSVTVEGVPTPTPFGFGGWVAMTKGDGGTEVMMGDLVLLQEEVNPVMSALLDNGLEVTALHNHFFWEEPRIFYMHIHGRGKPANLARVLKPALDLIGHPALAGRPGATPQSGASSKSTGSSGPVSGLRWSPPDSRNRRLRKPESTSPAGASGAGPAAQGKMDTAKIARIVGHAGEQAGPAYKITIGRDDLPVKEMGATINARMGLNTWAAFVGTDDKAVVAGDVAMLENEVTPVLKALRQNGLDVVAIHHHMLGVHPTIIFLHYWGQGPTEKLATGFKAALDKLAKGGATAKLHHQHS